jgi:hypothetical protein
MMRANLDARDVAMFIVAAHSLPFPKTREELEAAFAVKDSHRRADYIKLAERLLAARVRA